MLFSAIITKDEKEHGKVRARRALRCRRPSQSGCWRDRVARPGSDGNTLRTPETHTAGLKFGEDKMRNPVTDV